MLLWVLVEEINDYDQPPHTIRVIWGAEPTFEGVLEGIGGDLQNTESILIAAHVFQNRSVSSDLFNDSRWILKEVPTGEDLCEFLTKKEK